MISAILSLTALGLALGTLLGIADRFLRVPANPLEAEIEALLPGSQCGQCGYPGCAPAAAALAAGEAAVTCCPPGGRALAEALAEKLGVTLDASAVAEQVPMVAFIHERSCIGCTKCLKRCPTDAILGAKDMIHAVFADACTGCELCFADCPTECIEMRPVGYTPQTWYWPLPQANSNAGKASAPIMVTLNADGVAL
ncbi:electron transport complex subunit RsxB [Thiorhodovibrio frisius]|uniref:Ion-translocating oxidoreductase complex subunit B n=1 Tax=Thiorhodovibrio frisius TaxID=631362 RepID=H8Z3P0_9GAMM|nr:electron transport complex subunit RsxB [Thiorhodovibrio frisius]EIC20029.1 electron transport complex, RnfABCDGE type, B subunit [Thiorhodovibrio frisius]WPL20757.1 Nitrogen fixation protein rnfB [Thiorhodovibrio frisius]